MNAPQVRLVSVGGVPVPESTTGSFTMPDVLLNQSTAVTLEVAGLNIPVGTVVRVVLNPETGEPVAVDSDPLAGTLANSTATAGPVTIPHGFTRFVVSADWGP